MDDEFDEGQLISIKESKSKQKEANFSQNHYKQWNHKSEKQRAGKKERQETEKLNRKLERE